MAISATAKAGWRVLQLAGEHATLIHVSSTQADRYRVSRRPTTDQPTQSSQAGRPRPFQWAGRVVLAALAFLLVSDLVLVVPGYVVDRDLGRDGRLAPAELVKAKNDARATLLQGIGGLVLLLGALAAWRQLQPGREQLNVAGMLRNRRLARAIADTSMAELRRQLVYKTTWYGAELVTADRFYPSSKTCSACGWVKAKLTLAERTFQCDACGFGWTVT